MKFTHSVHIWKNNVYYGNQSNRSSDSTQPVLICITRHYKIVLLQKMYIQQVNLLLFVLILRLNCTNMNIKVM